jgi:hypothetical protein
MQIQFALGLAAGVGVGNFLIYLLLWGKPWPEALGIGATAAVICVILSAAFNYFTK